MQDEAYTFHDLTDQVLKGYQIHERIGAGGFGAVFRASQPVIQREVAIKVILPQYANQPYFIRRFETEAQLVARLEHPHIVPLYDYWREPTGAYLVLWDVAAYPGGLIEWIQKNRYVPEFSCVQRVFYRIEPLCETTTS